MPAMKDSACCFTLLSQLALGTPAKRTDFALPSAPPSLDFREEAIVELVTSFRLQDFAELWLLAESHHIILRAFPALRSIMAATGRTRWIEWIDDALSEEQARISCATSFLSPICQALEQAGEVVVIKSLDHWPDLGSDLDLYINAKSTDVIAIMGERFNAKLAQRSWGDRIANKWNFIVPGLPELVEIHVARLGQTGEQVSITKSLIMRASSVQFGEHSFRVAAPEDRMIISTLQRMYRHFYIRLCDIVDNAQLIRTGAVNYFYLRSLAHSAGLWQGLASYLVIVASYVKRYQTGDLPLPAFLTEAAQFGNERIRYRRKFLRVPMFPDAANLYLSEWKRLLLNGELGSTVRLTLLPGLAAAAALELTITGSDKGIW